jgi:hypothetical protein
MAGTLDYFGPSGSWDANVSDNALDYFGPGGWITGGGATIVNATVTAIVAVAIALGIVPTISADASRVALVAEATAEGIPTSLRADSVVVSVIAEAIADGIAAALRGDSQLTPPVAEANAAGILPGIRGDSVITALVAEAIGMGNTPTIRGDSVLAAVLAEASAQGIVPNIRGDATVIATIASAVAEAFASDGLPTVSMSYASISGVVRSLLHRMNKMLPDEFRSMQRYGGGSPPITGGPVLKLVADGNCYNEDGDVCGNGERINSWLDTSGHSLNATASYIPPDPEASYFPPDPRPIYITYGGKPYVMFSGTSLMSVAASPYLNPIDEWTMFVAGRSISTLFASRRPVLGKGSTLITLPSYSLTMGGAWVGADCRTIDAATPSHVWGDYGDSFRVNGSVSVTQNYVWTVKYRTSGNIMTVSIRQNGVEITPILSDSGALNGEIPGNKFAQNGSGALTIGYSGPDTYVYGFQGRIYEIRLYNKIEDDTHVERIEAELMRTYLP